jgi:hypothetical protein
VVVLHGIVAPPGEGMVIEVHLDIIDAPAAFLCRLGELGFESDPFLEFSPPEYRLHYTGRTRAPQNEVAKLLRSIRRLVAQIIEEAHAANVKMYAESELVRKIHHFHPSGSVRSLKGLGDLGFHQSPHTIPAKADIHVEFCSGTVSNEVRSLLLEKCFYWVRTPASERFPSEEIATLQTSAFDDGQQVYERLVNSPLPACTGIHLEQKLAMIASHPNLSMPAAIQVTRLTGSHP